MSVIRAFSKQVKVALSVWFEVGQLEISAPLSSITPNFSGYPARPFKSAKTALVVARLKLWFGSSEP